MGHGHSPGLRTALVALAVVTIAPTPGATAGTAAAATHRPPTRVLGFYADWDPASYKTLAAHYRDITVLSPGWLMFAADGTLVHDDSSAETRVNAFIADKHPAFALEPLVANWDPATDDWDADALAAVLADPARREALATNITAEAQANGWQGINVDFEELPETSRADLTAFMRSLYGMGHPLGLEISQDVGVDDPVFDHSALATTTDFLVPMFYDQHWAGSSAEEDAQEGTCLEDGRGNRQLRLQLEARRHARRGHGFPYSSRACQEDEEDDQARPKVAEPHVRLRLPSGVVPRCCDRV